MPTRFVRLLLLVLIVTGLVLYIYQLNPEPVLVTYRTDSTWKAPLAVVLIVAFCTGVLTTALCTLIIGALLQFRNWQATKRLDALQAHYRLVTSAREHLALGNTEQAKTMLLKVIDRDPEDVHARILLATAIKDEGNLSGALRVLEDARAEQKKNTELLLLAADINAALGNRTASFDNAGMVLRIAPKNKGTLRRLVSDCRELGRFDEAIDYQSQLIRTSPASEQQVMQEQLATLELDRTVARYSTDRDSLRQALLDILRRHRDFPPALSALGRLERDALDLKSATTYWKKAYQVGHDTSNLEQLAAMWLEAEEPERAIEAVRGALAPKDRNEVPNPAGHLFLVQLLLHLEHIDEARREYEYFKSVAGTSPLFLESSALVHARLLERDGKLEKAYSELVNVVEAANDSAGAGIFALPQTNGSSELEWKGKAREQQKLRKQPSPLLSTP